MARQLHRTLSGASLTALAFALAAGCGRDTVDASKVEAGIEQSLSTATAQVSGVSCPDDVEKEDGATFNCDAKLEGAARPR